MGNTACPHLGSRRKSGLLSFRRLADGVAAIVLGPTFAQTVNTGVEYHVFLTPKGDCQGLYVDGETPAEFEARATPADFAPWVVS